VLDIDSEEIIETDVIVELDAVLIAWARATDPELNDERRARKATITRMHMFIRLLKPATFTPN
jgi:hypothetical protein